MANAVACKMDSRSPQTDNKRLSSDHVDEVRRRLAERSPDAAFTAAEAAIYTGRSTRTLKRAIDAGVGPKREKNPDVSGLGATNRHTRYRKADLDAWREGLVGFATDFHGFQDLTLDAPWVIEGDCVAGHLLDLADVEAVLEVLAANAAVFLRLDEALLRHWVSANRRLPYQEAFTAICQSAMQAADSAAQRDALEEATMPAEGGSRRRPGL